MTERVTAPESAGAGSEAQARLEVERRLLERGGDRGRIPRLEAGERPPLAFAQERMFLLERMLPDVSAYNVPRCLRVPGRLDPVALQSALDVVASRHEVLRTTIELRDGAPSQRLHEDARIELAVHDLRGRPAFEADELVTSLAWEPFDLARDLLVRAALIQLDDDDRLLLVSHHLASDHASGGILLRELAEGYAAALEGRDPKLPELPIQYGDYAAWQRNRFGGQLVDSLVDYWRGQLAGAPDRFDLPSDRPRPPAKTYAGAELRFALSSELVDEVRSLARSLNTSFFTVFLAAFYALLHRYTEAEDIVIGAPISGRHHDETQQLIGYFSNTLALRIAVDDDLTFVELLERARTATLEAFAHQELPFERLVEALNPHRDPSHTPVFQVLLSHDVAGRAVSLGGMTLEQMPLPSWPWSRFDLALGVQDRHDGGLDGIVEYSTDLFDEATIGRLVGHLTTMLEGIVAEPRRQIGKLPILPDSERRALLDVNRTDRAVDGHCLHELVASHATSTPERVAVEGSGRSITYGELDMRANQLAQLLRHRGVGAGDVVGICLDRVPETMVAMLGTLKAGAAYVPVEPTYPRERQAFMLEDANAAVLVTQESLLDTQPTHSGSVVCLDRDRDELAGFPPVAPAADVDSDSLAYVIYTSGSTGRPKGVEIRHGSVVNLLAAMREQPGLEEDDVVVNVTTSAFDLSVPDLYLPLVYGAKLVILPREQTQDPVRLAAALDDVGATFMQATPTTWRLLVDAGWTGRPALKIVCGGEALPQSLAHELLDRGASLWHMYGPTETTVWSSAMQLTRNDGAPPIGGPIANTSFYIVDRRLQLSPIGVGGELLIGGAGLARGYRGRDDLTAEKFVADPFGPTPDARVYRTGDRMRLRADGTLEFLGRLDHQVKLHGYRIELGEIEAALDAHPDVRQSVAILHEDKTGDKRLVAYVVPEGATEPATDELRRHVGAFVPAYMVPSAIVHLDELPRTANGKLNTAALPKPDARRPDLRAGFVAPSTPAEEVLAGIWTELLGVDRVGANDDFFDLGGHSLLALKMLAHVHDAFDVELYLTTVFERPRLGALAAVVAERVVADAPIDDLAALLTELEAEEL